MPVIHKHNLLKELSLPLLYLLISVLLSQDYSVEGMSESLLTFLQHLREFGLVFQRKVGHHTGQKWKQYLL